MQAEQDARLLPPNQNPPHDCQVNVLDMFELSTELLPYFFVLQTLMMEGVVPWVDLSGLLIGYAWEVRL